MSVRASWKPEWVDAWFRTFPWSFEVSIQDRTARITRKLTPSSKDRLLFWKNYLNAICCCVIYMPEGQNMVQSKISASWDPAYIFGLFNPRMKIITQSQSKQSQKDLNIWNTVPARSGRKGELHQFEFPLAFLRLCVNLAQKTVWHRGWWSFILSICTRMWEGLRKSSSSPIWGSGWVPVKFNDA